MGVLPQRPAPTRNRARWRAATAWVHWFGAVRLVAVAGAVVVLLAGAVWWIRPPALDTSADVHGDAPVESHDPAPADPPADPPGDVPGDTSTDSTPDPPAITLVTAATPPRIDTSAPPEILFVHVAGAVVRPGVYTLEPGDRVIAAVHAAGGSLPDAALHALNLAALLVDGQRVHVPVEGEPVQVEPSWSGSPAGSVPTAPGPVNLNTADAAALQTLPGIGPAIAAAIVEFRAVNGPFSRVDDLVLVSGVGPAKLEAIRARVVL